MDSNYIKKISLLYVEDEKSVREALSKKLERLVKELYVAEDGEDGYSKYLEFKPDIILTDITMPKLNGIEMSRNIREVDKDIPIIVISAHSDSNSLISAIDCGVTSYLLKPLNKYKLLELLEVNAKCVSI